MRFTVLWRLDSFVSLFGRCAEICSDSSNTSQNAEEGLKPHKVFENADRSSAAMLFCHDSVRPLPLLN